ncbi:MAG TPA: modification methylase [Clostridiales bacterium]|nr:modification methylase [Clostridiales bacterium]
MSGNTSLLKASIAKDDEFWTQIRDIEEELRNYYRHFKDKVIFCNCDDPEHSNFWRYFRLNFNHLGLKKLVATHFDANSPTYKLEFDGKWVVKTDLIQNGDFRSPECIEILKESDIVVTNPPFSLFREYIAQLVDYDKKFVIIGNQNAITYKEIFALLKENKVWLGYKSGDMAFRVPDHYPPRKTRFWIDGEGKKWRSLGNICWFTNLDIAKRHEDLPLYKKYNEAEFPKYDDYDAINVGRISDIPVDYDGIMGVPVTFLHKYNPKQFELVGIDRYVEDNPHYGRRFTINGKETYARILIINKRFQGDIL